MIRVCLAGATGWAGAELARGIARTDDLELVAAVGRRHAGQDLATVLGKPVRSCPIYATVEDALGVESDVLVEYTKPGAAKANVLAGLGLGVHVVVGTSGLTDDDFAAIDVAARVGRRGVLACGNFALTAVLLQRFAAMAAKVVPQWEIIDYGSDRKTDAPSGTVRELANRLAQVGAPNVTVPVDHTVGRPDARGATVAGSQVHAVRLPSFVVSAEVIFGMPDQRLTIRHDAGNSALPYVDGALLAVRRVSGLVGVHRGLDTVLDL